MPREAFIGRTVREMLGDDAYRAVQPHIDAALAGRPTEFELELPYARGGTRHVHGTYVPLRDGVGGVTGIVVLVVDVTERMRGARFGELFVGMLGHDLRNPLSAIVTGAQLLERRQGGDNRRLIGRIVSSAERMSRMIDQILDLTRIRLGKGVPIVPAPVDLAAVCRTVIDELCAGRDDVAIDLDVAATADGVWDGDRLAQLFGNLVGNAVQHRAGAGRVLVAIDGTGEDRVVIRVHNDGVIPTRLLPHLFEPFSQGRANSERTSGLGLGLYISREVVHAHGGAIDVASDETRGTTFTVTLPRLVAGAEVQGRP
jgi:signal transduction histidine kinase